MKFRTAIDITVELTEERKGHILEEHPELLDHFDKLKKVLLNPDEIRTSKTDQQVLLFYHYFAKIKSGLYIVVVIKTNERNFILTAHMTDKVKIGEKYEIQKN